MSGRHPRAAVMVSIRLAPRCTALSDKGPGAANDGGAVTTRIALFRAQDDAAHSEALLRARGFDVASAPATRIRPTGALPPREAFAAVVATSAKAISLLTDAAREAIAGLPLYVVGERASHAASEAGLRVALEAALDVAALSEALAARLAPHSRVLYLAGRDRKPALERGLKAAGSLATVLEIYVAEARPAWSAEEIGALTACKAALHYSRRSASLTIALADRAGVAGRLGAIPQVCLSADVAEPLRAAGWRDIACADAPRESSLLAALEGAMGR